MEAVAADTIVVGHAVEATAQTSCLVDVLVGHLDTEGETWEGGRTWLVLVNLLKWQKGISHQQSRVYSIVMINAHNGLGLGLKLGYVLG